MTGIALVRLSSGERGSTGLGGCATRCSLGSRTPTRPTSEWRRTVTSRPTRRGARPPPQLLGDPVVMAMLRPAAAGYRAILTSAASKFPLKVVLPAGVAAPALRAVTPPATSASTPLTTARVPLGADNFAGATSNEYGGPVVVVAASMRVPPLTATPAPVSKPVPPHVKACSNLLPVGCRWSTKASWEPAPKVVVVPAT